MAVKEPGEWHLLRMAQASHPSAVMYNSEVTAQVDEAIIFICRIT